MEDGVSEDRVHVVVEPNEARKLEALRVMQAEHDAVDERVEEEAGQDHQNRHEEQQVGGAFTVRPAEDGPASSQPDQDRPVPAERAWTINYS